MAKLVELIPVLSQQFDKRDYPEKTVGVFARHLRMARLLSTGGRGRGGAEMTPTDATNMILAMTSGLPSQDAAEAVNTYRNLRQSYVDYARDEGAPVVPWIDELKGATLGTVIDRLIASATTDEFEELGRLAMTVQKHNWYVLINVSSPQPGGEIIIGAGSPILSGEDRKYNTIIAAFHFNEGPKTMLPGDPDYPPPNESMEDFSKRMERARAKHRGWNSNRIRTESVGRGAIAMIGALLAGKMSLGVNGKKMTGGSAKSRPVKAKSTKRKKSR
jgi:hypothetical protein